MSDDKACEHRFYEVRHYPTETRTLISRVCLVCSHTENETIDAKQSANDENKD